MKISYIGPTGVFGGVRAITEHCNRLSERGHDCTLIHPDSAPMEWLPYRFAQRPVSDPGTGYDVVVGTAIGTWPQALTLAGDARACGLVQMADWLFWPKDGDFYRQTLEQFTTPIDVLAISEWLALLAEAVPGRKVYRIRNGIDQHLFFPESFPDTPPFDGVTIVTEGYSHNPAKDVDEYFKRCIRHLKWDKGRTIRALGFSQFQPTFEFDNHWVQPPQDLIRRIYSTGDIFLKASRYEGRPGPDLEAMACGAVVCRAIGAGGDDLHDEDNCLVVPYGDYDGFVANCERLIDDPALRKRLRENGMKYVKEHCDWPGAIDLVEQALTGSVTMIDPAKDYAYDLASYNPMQAEIVSWETPQAFWLGQTLAEILQPRSVIDIGCGPGIYLVPFKPDAKVLGVDGAPDAGKALEADEFVTADLRENWEPSGGGVFDLDLCIETAEHLPPLRADYLVGLLTENADSVFFSAAIPGQGGLMHLNEQPREYWLEKFRARGFDLHPRNDWLAEQIKASPECQRVRWLISNAMLLERATGHGDSN